MQGCLVSTVTPQASNYHVTFFHTLMLGMQHASIAVSMIKVNNNSWNHIQDEHREEYKSTADIFHARFETSPSLEAWWRSEPRLSFALGLVSAVAMVTRSI